MGRGIFNIPESAGTGSGGGDFIRRLFFKQDQESAVIRFLSDADEIFFAQFHDIDDPPFQELCVKAEFGQVCRRCDKGRQPRMKFLAWVFEYTHDYIDEDDAIKVAEDDYEIIELRGGREIYRVEVNEVRLLTMSAAHKGAIKQAAEEHGSLLDREYKMVRMGEAGNQRTQYILKDGDEEEMSDELEALAEGLPDLEDVADGTVESLDPDEDEKPRRKSRKRRVEEEEEEEEERPRRKAKKSSRPKKKTKTRRPARREDPEDDDGDAGEEPLF